MKTDPTTPGKTLPEQLRWQAPEAEAYPSATRRLLILAADELERLERERQTEFDIVDRVWKALGITSYEQAGGKAIQELVADLKAERDKAVPYAVEFASLALVVRAYLDRDHPVRDLFEAALAKNPNPSGLNAAASQAGGINEDSIGNAVEPSGPVGLGPSGVKWPGDTEPSEFQVWEGEEFIAKVDGRRDRALAEARRYASQCDPRLWQIEEVARRVIEGSE